MSSAAYQFNRLFSYKNLQATYHTKISKSSVVGNDRINKKAFESRLEENIEVIYKKVKNQKYEFTTYKQKLISKGALSKPRVISIPTLRDRLTLRCLCDLLQKTFQDDVKLEIPQIKIFNIQKDIESGLFDGYIKIDISAFYPSIDHILLMKILRKKIRKKEILSLIEKAIKNGTSSTLKKKELYINDIGVPQGLSISNILAEIYFSDIDKKMKAIDNIEYYRYVDDILILCKVDQINSIADKIIFETKEHKLDVHPLNENDSKSSHGSLSEQFGFLGYEFNNYKTSVRLASKERFESSIVKLLTTYKYRQERAKNNLQRTRLLKILEWRINLRITGCIFESERRGWLFYFSQINDLEVLHKIDSTILKLIDRFLLTTRIKPKSIVKAFFESKSNLQKNKYIVNFDNMNTIQKRKILEVYLGEERLNGKSDSEIDRLFGMKISKVIKELEEDLQNLS